MWHFSGKGFDLLLMHFKNNFFAFYIWYKYKVNFTPGMFRVRLFPDSK